MNENILNYDNENLEEENLLDSDTDILDEDIFDDEEENFKEAVSKDVLMNKKMQENWDDFKTNHKYYFEFIEKIVNQAHVVKKEHLAACLQRFYNIEIELAKKIIERAQRNNVILIDIDGYVTNYNYYMYISKDKFMDRLILNDKYCKIPFSFKRVALSCDPTIKNIDKVMSIISLNMPYSAGFFITNKPWDAVFMVDETEETESSLVQIAVFDKEESFKSKCALLRSLEDIPEEMRSVINRIAIIDDEEMARNIPYIGFSLILKSDGNIVEVIENREEPWNA